MTSQSPPSTERFATLHPGSRSPAFVAATTPLCLASIPQGLRSREGPRAALLDEETRNFEKTPAEGANLLLLPWLDAYVEDQGGSTVEGLHQGEAFAPGMERPPATGTGAVQIVPDQV